MTNKPTLTNANVIKDIDYDSIPGLSETVKAALKAGMGSNELNSSELGINAKFTIKEYEFNYGADGFACSGTKNWISIFKLSGGCNNLWAFEEEGCEKSENYESIPSSHILDISTDHDKAIAYLNENCIGKTLRVVARSAEGCTQYGGRYYLFAIE